MSNILDRLRKLKAKQPQPEQPFIQPQMDKPGTIEESVDGAATPEDAKKKEIIGKLKGLIAHVQKTPENLVSEELKTRPSKGLLTETMPEGPGQNIEDLIPGDILETPLGRCFRVKTVYPWHHFQGKTAVSSLMDASTHCLEWVIDDERLHSLDFRRTIFFDTETTGLEMGAGTYIFLAGFGYFEDRSFVVEQFFMRDFPDEPAVLHEIDGLLGRFSYLVTYNGKIYDWPLLESRFIVNRRPMPLLNPPHLDLLFLARRLFKSCLEDCKLTSVEKGILDFHRFDDVPGAMIPDLYFKYLRTRDARFIQQTFAHNANDIVSMAAIASEMLRFLNEPSADERWRGKDMYAYARMKENAGENAAAEKAYREALNAGLDRFFYEDALERLSILLKRRREWEEAVKIWNLMIQTEAVREAFPYIELAKHYEHRLKDCMAAKDLTRTALDVMAARGELKRGLQEALMVRLQRLEYKCMPSAPA